MYPSIDCLVKEFGLNSILVSITAIDALIVFGSLNLVFNQCLGLLNPEQVKSTGCDSFFNSVCSNLADERTVQLSTVAYTNTNAKMLETMNSLDSFRASKTDYVLSDFYSVCQKLGHAEDDWEKMTELLRKSGGFPVLEENQFDSSKWSWMDTTRKLRKLGLFLDSLFTTTLGSNPLDLRNVTFYIKHPRLDLSLKACEEGVECKPMVSFVTGFIEVMVFKFGVDMRIALEDSQRIFDLEKKLLRMVWENPTVSKESLAEEFQMRTLANLSSSFGFINWREYFTILLGSDELVTGDLVVVVDCPRYLWGLKSVLEDTPKRVLANFIMWSALSRLKEYIPGYRRTSLDCYKILQNTMSYALQSMYARSVKSFNPKAERTVLEIATEIKKELLKRVRSSDWMSDHLRAEVAEKVERVKIHVGYPQILLNSTFIDDYYTDLKTNDNALQSMLSVQKFQVDKYFSLCCKLVEEVFWHLGVDASLPLVYYDHVQNAVHVLPGVLQDPIYKADGSVSEHFGRLGSLIAHEIVHAVDSIGYRYSGDGKRKSFFNDAYLAVFQLKSECFVHQYNSFMDLTEDFLSETLQASGEFKKLEMIADAVGLDLSFAAFKAYSENTSRKANDKLADWDFTPEQKFFVSFAQFFCAEYSEEELFLVLMDDQPPNFYRVDGILNNSEDFGTVFDCQIGSRMNPKNKCKVW